MDAAAPHDAAIKEMTEIILSLPPEETEAYREAILSAQNVVQSESHPAWFLRVEDGDTRAASIRMALYWKHRVKLFGRDRAFLPFDVSSSKNSALADEDLALLATGITVRLPDAADGTPTILNDVSRLKLLEKESEGSRGRGVFYWLTTLAMQSERAQTDGIILLRLVEMVRFKLSFFQSRLFHFFHAMPVKVKTFEFCCQSSEAAAKHISRVVVPVLTKALLPYRDRSQVNVFTKPSDICAKLAVWGLEESGLPPSLGGTWSYDNFDLLLLQQLTRGNQDHEKRPCPTREELSQDEDSPTSKPSAEEEILRATKCRRLDMELDVLEQQLEEQLLCNRGLRTELKRFPPPPPAVSSTAAHVVPDIQPRMRDTALQVWENVVCKHLRLPEPFASEYLILLYILAYQRDIEELDPPSTRERAEANSRTASVQLIEQVRQLVGNNPDVLSLLDDDDNRANRVGRR